MAAAALGAGQRRGGDARRAVAVSATSSKSRAVVDRRAVGGVGQDVGEPAQARRRRGRPTRRGSSPLQLAAVQARRGRPASGDRRASRPRSRGVRRPRPARRGRRPPDPPAGCWTPAGSRRACPVRATSPAANSPGSSVRPYTSVDDAAAAVVRARHHRNRLARRVDARGPAGGGDGRERVSKPSIRGRRGTRTDRRSRSAARRSRAATTSRGARSPIGCTPAVTELPCASSRIAPSPRTASVISGRRPPVVGRRTAWSGGTG